MKIGKSRGSRRVARSWRENLHSRTLGSNLEINGEESRVDRRHQGETWGEIRFLVYLGRTEGSQKGSTRARKNMVREEAPEQGHFFMRLPDDWIFFCFQLGVVAYIWLPRCEHLGAPLGAAPVLPWLTFKCSGKDLHGVSSFLPQ